jgi:hypothetical protein
MSITRKKLFAAGALFATGMSAMALTDSPTQAMSLHGPGTPAYAVSRILDAFDVVAEMPPVEPVRVPTATKGDLPSRLLALVCTPLRRPNALTSVSRFHTHRALWWKRARVIHRS